MSFCEWALIIGSHDLTPPVIYQCCPGILLDRVGFNLIKLKFSPNSSRVFHCLATSANSHQVFLLSLCDLSSDNWMVSCKLVWLGGIVWPLVDASFDFVTWPKLAWVGPGLMHSGFFSWQATNMSKDRSSMHMNWKICSRDSSPIIFIFIHIYWQVRLKRGSQLKGSMEGRLMYQFRSDFFKFLGIHWNWDANSFCVKNVPFFQEGKKIWTKLR